MTRRLLVVLLLSVATLLGIAVPASAHDVLISSDPADGATLGTAPARITLTFNEPVQQDFDTVTVTGPGGTRWEAGAATVTGNAVTAPVRPLGPAGQYTVGYRIISADGHPVTGAVSFTLAKAGTGTPATTAPSTTPTGGQGGGGMPLWAWIAGAVVLLGVGVVLAMRLGRHDEES